MKCGYSEELLAMHVEGDLSPAQSVQLQGHLVECAACDRLVAELKESHLLLKSLRQDTVGSSVVSSVHQQVMNQIGVPAGAGMLVRLERLVFGLRWRYALAGLVFAVLVSALVWQLRKEPVQIATTITPPPVSVPLPEIERQVPVPEPVRPVVRRKRAPAPVQQEVIAEEPREVLVKLYTDDPNVVIYWLIDQSGGSE